MQSLASLEPLLKLEVVEDGAKFEDGGWRQVCQILRPSVATVLEGGCLGLASAVATGSLACLGLSLACRLLAKMAHRLPKEEPAPRH